MSMNMNLNLKVKVPFYVTVLPYLTYPESNQKNPVDINVNVRIKIQFQSILSTECWMLNACWLCDANLSINFELQIASWFHQKFESKSYGPERSGWMQVSSKFILYLPVSTYRVQVLFNPWSLSSKWAWLARVLIWREDSMSAQCLELKREVDSEIVPTDSRHAQRLVHIW